MIENQELYPLGKLNNIIQIRVNNIIIPIKIVKMDRERYISIASYLKVNYDVKKGIIDIWADKKNA